VIHNSYRVFITVVYSNDVKSCHHAVARQSVGRPSLAVLLIVIGPNDHCND
jgi:hypothetical protein